MSLKSIKDELATLQATQHPEETEPSSDDKDPIPLKRGDVSAPEILTSSNGIRYLDPRPLKYCIDYQMIVKPTIKCCQRCGAAWEVIKLVDEEWIWYLDPDSGNVTEHGDENSIPVTAFLKIAEVGKKDLARIEIVTDRFKDMTDCPRRTPCKP